MYPVPAKKNIRCVLPDDLIPLSSVDIFLKGSNLMNIYRKGRKMEVIKTTPYYQSDKTTNS